MKHKKIEDKHCNCAFFVDFVDIFKLLITIFKMKE